MLMLLYGMEWSLFSIEMRHTRNGNKSRDKRRDISLDLPPLDSLYCSRDIEMAQLGSSMPMMP